jgi:hypothetical protein
MSIPQQTVQDTLLAAELKIATMVNTNLTALTGGSLSVYWETIKRAQRSVNAVDRQYSLGDFSSVNFLKAYTCLSSFVGTFAGGAINPNAQSPGIIIEIIDSSNYNQSDKIFFGPAFTYVISNYNSLYYPLYGNNPDIFLVTVDTTDPLNPVWQQDTATVPIFGYLTPNDATTPLVSITWTWGASTSGYIIISGLKPS